MRKLAISAILALSALIFSTPSHAKLVFMAGTVMSLFVSGDSSPSQSVTFTMSFVPQPTGCGTSPNTTNQVFVFTPADIPDAQTRINMLTVIIAARTSGIPLTVDWDNSATSDCDGPFPIPLFVGM